MGANTFRRGPHPKWVPMGPKFITKKILTSSDTPNPRYGHLRQPQNAHFPLPAGKRGSSFNNSNRVERGENDDLLGEKTM